jgi:hypothetical protein
MLKQTWWKINWRCPRPLVYKDLENDGTKERHCRLKIPVVNDHPETGNKIGKQEKSF